MLNRNVSIMQKDNSKHSSYLFIYFLLIYIYILLLHYRLILQLKREAEFIKKIVYKKKKIYIYIYICHFKNACSYLNKDERFLAMYFNFV